MAEEIIKIEVSVKIKYESREERRKAIKIAKHNILDFTVSSSTMRVEPIKAINLK